MIHVKLDPKEPVTGALIDLVEQELEIPKLRRSVLLLKLNTLILGTALVIHLLGNHWPDHWPW